MTHASARFLAHTACDAAARVEVAVTLAVAAAVEVAGGPAASDTVTGNPVSLSVPAAAGADTACAGPRDRTLCLAPRPHRKGRSARVRDLWSGWLDAAPPPRHTLTLRRPSWRLYLTKLSLTYKAQCHTGQSYKSSDCLAWPFKGRPYNALYS